LHTFFLIYNLNFKFICNYNVLYCLEKNVKKISGVLG